MDDTLNISVLRTVQECLTNAAKHASTKTVGVHHTRIRKKLGASNAAQLVHIAIHAGVIVT